MSSHSESHPSPIFDALANAWLNDVNFEILDALIRSELFDVNLQNGPNKKGNAAFFWLANISDKRYTENIINSLKLFKEYGADFTIGTDSHAYGLTFMRRVKIAMRDYLIKTHQPLYTEIDPWKSILNYLESIGIKE